MTSHPAPGGGRRRGPRHDLSREQVLDAVDTVLDRDGSARLSLRRVAAELDMAPNSVYTYAASWEDLLQDAADRFLARIDLAPLGASGCARCRIAAVLDHALALLGNHPGMADVLTGQRTIGPASLTLN